MTRQTQSNDAKVLLEMLTYCRPDGSNTERKFCDRYLPRDCEVDSVGNRLFTVGESRILFSCHTDTVHRKDGRQKIVYGGGKAWLSPKSQSSCLGADDTAGVWIMLQMIQAGVAGRYVFHVGEECGCIGSSHIARENRALLESVDYAVAFDRMGTNSIITQQMGEMCCSDAFARELASRLKMAHEPDPRGSFTDTAQYIYTVPECTNVSVGYIGQHSNAETLDVDYLLRLRDAVCAMNWQDLPIVRDPVQIDDNDSWSRWGRLYPDNWTPRYGPQLIDLVMTYPDAACDLLESLGIDSKEFIAHLDDFNR